MDSRLGFLRRAVELNTNTRNEDTIALVALKRLAHVGSDHFPILVELAIMPDDSRAPEISPADEADEDEAIDAMDDADDLLRRETAEQRRQRQLADQ